jgi:hypothetical protein
LRRPRARGMPVDHSRIRGWLDRFNGYRITVTDGRVRRWLANFRDDDRDLGARVLDAVTFVKYEDMEAALKNLVSHLPGWHKSEARRRGRWRFVAFSTSAGESGDLLLPRCRTALGLAGRRYDELFIHMADLLSARLGMDDSVVFVDDFAGTGRQACLAWQGDSVAGSTGLAELLPGNPKTYLVLIAAGQRAIARISQETDLIVRTSRVLGSADDIFSSDCQHFSDAEKASLLRYCRKADRRIPRGYGQCGFVIVLAHKTPNNSIPVLCANHDRWAGIFPRH